MERIHTILREELRVALGRDPQPSSGSVDSQSVKTASVGGERGYDGAKKLVGRKRRILVDASHRLIGASPLTRKVTSTWHVLPARGA